MIHVDWWVCYQSMMSDLIAVALQEELVLRHLNPAFSELVKASSLPYRGPRQASSV